MPIPTSPPERGPAAHDGGLELAFTDSDYRRIRELAKSRFGLELGEGKRALVYGRLARRLRKLGLRRFQDYLHLIEDPGTDESRCLINALTTNVTHFFREPHHFEFLGREVLPALFRPGRGDRRVRIWSAGCSTGEEPYSLAMTVREALPTPAAPALDVKILATDIDSEVLARARAGVYRLDRDDHLGPARLAKHFRQAGTRANAAGATVPGAAHLFEVNETVRQLVTFNRLNLLEPWPMQGLFDVIFCRNVVIYFDAATRNELVRRFRLLLKPQGLLFLGHSESLAAHVHGFQACGRTIYRRVEDGPSASGPGG